MKHLHKFTVKVPKKVEKTESVTRDGQEIKETRTVEELVDHVIILKQLSRSEADSGRLFNGASLKRAIDAGLITKAVLVQKHIDGNGSLISRETAKRIVELNQEVQSIRDEIVALGITEGNDEKQTKQNDLLARFEEVTRELRAIEGANRLVFDSTAENYATERSNLWIMLNQTYVERNGKPEHFFKGDRFEDRERALETMEETGDPLYLASAEKLATYWGYYLGGLVNTPEQFKELEDRLNKEANPDPAEEPKTETPAI